MKICLQCKNSHERPRSSFCSQQCSRLHRKETVPKICLSCKEEHFRRGKTCSQECASELKKQTNRDKFGSDWAIQTKAAKEKRVATNLEKYGEIHPLRTERSLGKLRETNQKRRGVDYPGQSEAIKKKVAETNSERYGADNPFASEIIKKRIKKKNLEVYGVEHPAQNEAVKRKTAKTNLEKYGAENPDASEIIKEKIKRKHIEVRGVSYPAQDPEVKEKIRQTNLIRYGVDSPLSSEEIKEKIRNIHRKNLGVDYPSQNPEVMRKIRKSYEETINSEGYEKSGRVSKLNRRIAKELEEEFGISTKLEVAYGEYSFDIGISGTNILLELNPTGTHNADIAYTCLKQGCSRPCEIHEPSKRDYHHKKATFAKENNLRLIQAYQWDIPKIVDFLHGKLGSNFRRFSSRKLELKKISKSEANEFLGVNHPQGGLKGATHCYGLLHESELVGVATFGKSRFGSKYSHEWLRYAVKKSVIIYGGPERLFQKFLKDENP